jgi:hypothetical protein
MKYLGEKMNLKDNKIVKWFKKGGENAKEHEELENKFMREFLTKGYKTYFYFVMVVFGAIGIGYILFSGEKFGNPGFFFIAFWSATLTTHYLLQERWIHLEIEKNKD